MKKTLITVLCAMLTGSIFLVYNEVKASKFDGKEDEYLSLCRQTDLTDAQKQDCDDFAKYYDEKYKDALDELDKNQAELENIKNDLNKLMNTINSYNNEMNSLQAQILTLEVAQSEVEANMLKLQKEIEKKEKDIAERDEQIKERLIAMQPIISTNMYFDFIMGSSSLVDLLRRAQGVEEMTKYDQEQIIQLEKDKLKLENDKKELDRQKKVLEEQKAYLDERKAYIEALAAQSNQLLDSYQLQEAEYQAKVIAANQDLEAIKVIVNNIDWVDADDIVSSKGLTIPVNGPWWKSAGTWYYDGGGIHLGMDFAASMGTEIVAPLNGVVLNANIACSNVGWLGHWCGNPAGGGNTVLMVGKLDGSTYAMSFSHMKRENMEAKNYVGKTILAGTKLGEVASSGNSTGPHLHFEMIYLGDISLNAAIEMYKERPTYDFGAGWGSLTTTCERNGWNAPCRVRPENYVY